MARLPRLTLWNWIFAALIAFGAYAVYLRRAYGWGPVAYLRDIFPWGLCSALNVFCGLAIAMGAFTVAATVHILDVRPYRDLVRPCTVLGFAGFLVASLTLAINRPFHTWTLAGTWSAHSIQVGILWTVLLYVLVLALVFLPELAARFRREFPESNLRLLTTGALLLATTLAALHQLALTRLIVRAPERFSPIWATSLLPTLFAISAVCAVLALLMVISRRTVQAYGRGFGPPVMAGLGKALAFLLYLYLLLRALDLLERRVAAPFTRLDLGAGLLALELSLLFAPTLLLSHRDGDLRRLDICSLLVLAGFITNRLNTGITAREIVAGGPYYPHWSEVAIAYSVIALAVACFALCVKHLPLLPAYAPEPDHALEAVAH